MAQHTSEPTLAAAVTNTTPAAMDPADTVARAWALKDRCYAAWSSDPPGAVEAARELAALADAPATREGPVAAAREVRAVADWTQGVALMIGGDLAAALACFDRAEDALLASNQEGAAAETQVPKLAVLGMLGRYDEAVTCAEAALERFKRLGHALGAAKVSLNLGVLHQRRGAYALSVQHLRQASVRFARLGNHEHSVMADIDLAKAFGGLGEFDEALRMLSRARERAQMHDFQVLLTMGDELVAEVRLARGEYRGALSGYESARRSFELLAMPQQQAIVEKQLADTYLELRLLPEALALYDVVLARLQSLDVPDEQAWTLTQRGRTQALLGRPTQAASSFEAARSIFAVQGNAVGEASVALARAELLVSQGRGAEATQWSDAAFRAFDRAGSADGAIRARLNRAQALQADGQQDKARSDFEALLAEARERHMLAVQTRCLTGLGRCAQALGDEAYAEHAYEAAIETLEEQRRALPGEELRQAFFGDRLEPYRQRLHLALLKHSRAPTLAQGALVLTQLERLRARTLLDRIGGSTRDDVDAEPATVEDPQVVALRDRANWLSRESLRMHGTGQATAAWTDELHRTERELLERVRRDRLHTVTRADGRRAGPWNPMALADAMSPRDALVEYGLDGNELFACIVTTDGVVVRRRLATAQQMLDAARAVRFQIEALKHGRAALQEHVVNLTERAQRRLRELHRLIVAPLAHDLRDCRRLIVVPCGALALVPFAALGDEQGVLAERYELAMAPSARMALHGLNRATPGMPSDMVAFGESSRLAHAAHEAQFVAGLVPSGRALVGEAATLVAWQAAAPKADALHVACHAQFRGDNPMFSALHLHDGPLTVEALGTTRLRAKLVVLSACETGLGDVGNGEESIGLVRAFLAAGAQRVVASLWPVEDAATLAFMRAFYAALGRGAGPALALRLAQIELKASHPHPFYWSAFALHGGW